MEYSDAVAQQLVAMVRDWNLATLEQNLVAAKGRQKKAKLPKTSSRKPRAKLPKRLVKKSKPSCVSRKFASWKRLSPARVVVAWASRSCSMCSAARSD